LDRRERAGLVGQIAGHKALPDQVIDQIADRTDGIPLFVEELTKSVLESGRWRADGDRYVLDGALPPFMIPATLYDSLLARLDRLGQAAKEAAQLGAVLGREFTYELAYHVAGHFHLDTALAQLTDAGLLFCRGVLPQSSYLFKHALVQEASYATLLRGRRQDLHARAAAVLEQQFTELVERQPELLARHYTEAGDTAQAVQWWQKAGQRAVRLSGNIEAIAYFGRAVRLISLLAENHERDLRELEIRIELGTALFGTKGYAATELAENYARAWTLCESSGSSEHALAVLWGQYLAEPPGKGFMPGQTKKAERFVQLAERQGDAGLQVIGHRMLGGCLVSEGEFISGRRHLECGVALYDWEKHKGLTVTFGAINPCISCQATLSLVLQYLGYPDQASTSGDRAVKEARRFDHFNTLGVALHLVGRFHAFRREQEQVRILAGELLALSRKHGSAEWELVAEILLGWQQARTGDLQRGLERVQRGTGGLRARNPYHLHLPAYLLFEAELHGEAGRYEDELRLLDGAHDVMDTQGQLACEAELYRLRGSALLARGAASEEIERCYEQSAEIAQRQSAKFWELRTAVSRARFWRDQGKRIAARDMLASVYGWFTEGLDTQDLREAKTLLGELEDVASTSRGGSPPGSRVNTRRLPGIM
jgi:tetratricopeptide (TPR) repeat protein